MLIDHYLPRYDVTEVQELPVDAPPESERASPRVVRVRATEARMKISSPPFQQRFMP